jgi:2'-5' RNA ligase
MLRAFIAVELPERFIPEIERIESMLNTPGVKLVEPKQVHITLKFLGNISEDNIEPIASALSHVNCKPFEAGIKGVGVFRSLHTSGSSGSALKAILSRCTARSSAFLRLLISRKITAFQPMPRLQE